MHYSSSLTSTVTSCSHATYPCSPPPPLSPFHQFRSLSAELSHLLLPISPHSQRTQRSQKARQLPPTWVCGGPTSTVWAPTTTVRLPSIPLNEQVAPPRERIWEMLSGLSKIMIVSNFRVEEKDRGNNRVFSRGKTEMGPFLPRLIQRKEN